MKASTAFLPLQCCIKTFYININNNWQVEKYANNNERSMVNDLFRYYT